MISNAYELSSFQVAVSEMWNSLLFFLSEYFRSGSQWPDKYSRTGLIVKTSHDTLSHIEYSFGDTPVLKTLRVIIPCIRSHKHLVKCDYHISVIG